MKKFFSIIILCLCAFALCAGFWQKRTPSRAERERLFVMQSIRALCAAMGVKQNAVTFYSFNTKKIFTAINTPCNFVTGKAQKYFVGYFAKEGFRVNAFPTDEQGLTTISTTYGTQFAVRFFVEKPTATVALVIDDVGYNVLDLYRFFELGIPVTFAVLPQLPLTNKAVELITQHGFDYILHQPMQPLRYSQMVFPGAFNVGDNAETIKKIFQKNLESVGDVSGVNNHMGSAFTCNEKSMKIFLTLLKEKNMFFLDSKTEMHSVAPRVARELGVVCLENKDFLDIEHTPGYVRDQLQRVIQRVLASPQRQLVMIGHIHTQALVPVLRELLPEFNRKRIQFVSIINYSDQSSVTSNQ